MLLVDLASTFQLFIPPVVRVCCGDRSLGLGLCDVHKMVLDPSVLVALGAGNHARIALRPFESGA